MKEIKEGDKVRITGDKLGHGLEIETIAIILGFKGDDEYFIKVGNGTYRVSISNVQPLEHPEPQQESLKPRKSELFDMAEVINGVTENIERSLERKFDSVIDTINKRLSALEKEVEQVKTLQVKREKDGLDAITRFMELGNGTERAKAIEEVVGLLMEELDRIKKQEDSREKTKRWRSGIRGEYYFADHDFCVELGEDDRHVIDNGNYKSGNYFPTREQAEHHANRLKTIAEIRNRIEELNGGWEPEFKNGEMNYAFHKYQGRIRMEYSSMTQHLETWKYFDTAEIGEQLIKEFGDRLKVLFE